MMKSHPCFHDGLLSKLYPWTNEFIVQQLVVEHPAQNGWLCLSGWTLDLFERGVCRVIPSDFN